MEALLTALETREFLRISERKLRMISTNKKEKGKLRCHKIGSRVLYDMVEIRRYLEEV